MALGCVVLTILVIYLGNRDAKKKSHETNDY